MRTIDPALPRIGTRFMTLRVAMRIAHQQVVGHLQVLATVSLSHGDLQIQQKLGCSPAMAVGGQQRNSSLLSMLLLC